MQAAIHQTSCRGLKTAWLQSGPARGPILFFSHGFPDSAESWDLQLQHFSKDFTVVAPYSRGACSSERGKNLFRYKTNSMNLDHLQILQEVDPKQERQVICVGHDLGAVHAWNLARLLGKRTAGLIVINGLTIDQMIRRMTNPRQILKSWYILLMQVPGLPELLCDKFPEQMLKLAHANGDLDKEFRPLLETTYKALKGPLNQYRAFLREAPKQIAKRHRRLRCPVLVLWGSRDTFLVPPTMDELEADAENLTVRIIPGNHWIHRDQAETVNPLIERFIQEAVAP